MIPANIFIQTVKAITHRYPAVIPHLKGRARWVVYSEDGKHHAITYAHDDTFDDMRRVIYPIGWQDLHDELKTIEYFRRALQGLIRGLYNFDVNRQQFLDITANLIQGQLTQAYHNGMADAGLSAEEITDRMQAELDALILGQYPYVDNLANEIINARTLGKPVEPLTARADMWANRWNEAFNAGKLAVASEFGIRMAWVLGPTEHCDTCLTCSGLIAFASEWEAAGLRPQSSSLLCGGFRCQCELVPTTERRSPNVLSRLMAIPRK